LEIIKKKPISLPFERDRSRPDGDRRVGRFYLLLAGAFEIGWPVGINISQVPETRGIGIAIAAELFDVAGRLLLGGIGSFALPDLTAAPDPLLPVAV